MATEKRLIDVTEPLRLFYGWLKQLELPEDEGDKRGVESCISILEGEPTVDAVELPCKIGDKVYRIAKGNDYFGVKPFIQELTVTEISWKKEKYGDKDLGFAIIADGIRYRFTSIGKSVFLTRKEAEAKMDGERKDNG